MLQKSNVNMLLKNKSYVRIYIIINNMYKEKVQVPAIRQSKKYKISLTMG